MPAVRILRGTRAPGWFFQCAACGEASGTVFDRQAAVDAGCEHLLARHRDALDDVTVWVTA